ncbi:phosphatase [Cytophagaceae bacterium ABcell3]|nr:phosphatase [Cytophagaceae bacterium ABcell3]
MKLGAVDIGSNAIRIQITKVLRYNEVLSFKKLEYVRFPLRLGHDVFKYGEISAEKEAKFIKLIQTFKNFLELYEVDDFVICATSAMREAKNGSDIAYKVRELLGVSIEIIEGDLEAELINKVLYNELDENKSYIHIDVGGGSTELNIYENKKKMASRSFKIGSVRLLNGTVNPEEWDHMKNWVEQNIKNLPRPVVAIGTGGNIGKIYDVAKLNQPKDKKHFISLERIGKVKDFISSYDYEERIHVLMLNPDRADVILPASDIYMKVMKWAKATKMFVPEVGLKDGLMLMLYEKHKDKVEDTNFVTVNKYQK